MAKITKVVKVLVFLCHLTEFDDGVKLKCYLKDFGDPYHKLNPFKEEVAHIEPGIWQYHDVISTDETAAIRRTAAPFVSLVVL